MKRILHIVGSMPRAGAETMLMNLYRKIDRTQYQFDFLYFSDLESDYDEEIKKLGGRILHCRRGKFLPTITQIFETYRIIKKAGPFYAVHAHTLFNIPFSLIGAWIAGVTQRVAHSHNTSDSHSFTKTGRAYQTISKFLIAVSSTKYLACGTAAGKYLFPYTDPSSIVTLPNAIDTEKFTLTNDKKTIISEFNIRPNQLVVIQIGRLTEEKNHEFSISLINRLVKSSIDVKAIFVGVGPLETKLKAMTRTLELDNTIVWPGVRNDIPSLLSISNAMILPSYFEGFPVVLVEAQALGVPCLVSDRVSSEVDLGVNLTSFLSIETNNRWSESLIEIAKGNYSKPSSDDIYNALACRDLTIQRTVPKLYQCYE